MSKKEDEDLAVLTALRELPRGKRITGKPLIRVTRALIKKYNAGASLRALARITGRSYGFVHRTLGGAVDFRPRGGAYKNKPS